MQMILNSLSSIKFAGVLLFYLFFSATFFIGLMMIIAPKAFKELDSAMNREFGLKKIFFPKIEKKIVKIIDEFMLRNNILSGAVLIVISLAVLILFRL